MRVVSKKRKLRLASLTKKLGAFLKKQRVSIPTRTPSELQVIRGGAINSLSTHGGKFHYTADDESKGTVRDIQRDLNINHPGGVLESDYWNYNKKGDRVGQRLTVPKWSNPEHQERGGRHQEQVQMEVPAAPHVPEGAQLPRQDTVNVTSAFVEAHKRLKEGADEPGGNYTAAVYDFLTSLQDALESADELDQEQVVNIVRHTGSAAWLCDALAYLAEQRGYPVISVELAKRVCSEHLPKAIVKLVGNKLMIVALSMGVLLYFSKDYWFSKLMDFLRRRLRDRPEEQQQDRPNGGDDQGPPPPGQDRNRGRRVQSAAKSRAQSRARARSKSRIPPLRPIQLAPVPIEPGQLMEPGRRDFGALARQHQARVASRPPIERR